MLVQQSKVDVASNNLANVNTTGFFKEILTQKALPAGELVREEKGSGGESAREVVGETNLGVVVAETAMDATPGVVKSTGNPLDCAIKGKGFFQLSDGQNLFYTRAGNFTLDSEGRIVTPSGLFLMGEGGPIEVGDAQEVTIREDGSVIADGEVVGVIALYDFERPSFLRRLGHSLFSATPDSGEAILQESVSLAVGALEGSNVNVVEEMARLIEASRAYEAASKSFESENETAQKMVETFGV
ncbi:MAG: flagellar basal-body rod protein FlgF [Thermovirga sp.]|jgi:flagellar basal-body rod protein FlgG|nr:flagellar basal-body rod protein FlgF [Thermovirga sp.]